MKHTMYPLHILPATFVSERNCVRFRTPDGKFLDCYKHHELIWKILELANGRLTQSELETRLTEALPAFDKKTCVAALEQLLAIGVLIDGFAVTDVFHQYTNNPSLFPNRLSSEEVIVHSRSKRLPVKMGKKYTVRPRPTSHMANLQAARRTVRSFRETPITLTQLGHTLITAYSLSLHSTPSGGALYPLKLYAIVLKDDDTLPAGLYEYNPETHEVVLYDASPFPQHIAYAMNDEQILGGAPVVIVVAGDIERNRPKYSGRGYRLMLLEAGHAAQNIQLAATEQKLGCYEYAGFQEDALDALLHLNEEGEHRVLPLITLAIGHPAKQGTHAPQIANIIKKLEDELVGEDKTFAAVQVVNLRETWARHAAIRSRTGSQYTYAAGGTAESAEYATLKALAEAYERNISSEVKIDIEATATQLTDDGKQWLDPRVVAPLAPTRFSGKASLETFSEDTLLQWVAGKTAGTNRTVHAPIDLVYYPLHAERWNRKPLSLASSSGVAAYTDRQTAIEKGLLELLERHCLMTTWHIHKSPEVIPSKLLPAYWQEHTLLLAKRGWDVHVMDISSGYGEVTLKVVIESKTQYPHYVNGAASSFTSFEHALQKAFQEAETAIETIPHKQPDKLLKPQEVQSVSDHGAFYAHEANAPKLAWLWQGNHASSIPEPSTTAAKLLTKLDPVVFDMSPTHAPLHVVRVICQELVPIGFGYGNSHYLHHSLRSRVHPESLILPHDFA